MSLLDDGDKERLGDLDEERISPEQLRREFQEKAQTYLVEQGQHVVIPSFTKWFNLNKIAPIEERSFPDIFGEHKLNLTYKNPELYKNMRDFMINCYRLNPREYLTITAIRRNLCGDVGIIIRIHQFLEKWGLINYQIDPRTKPSLVGPQYTGHFQITLDTPSGLIPYLPEYEKNGVGKSAQDDIKEEDDEKSNVTNYNLEIRKNVYSTDFKNSSVNSNIVQYFCNVCGKDTSETRYHNLKIKAYSHQAASIANANVVCQLCYDQGLFPSNFQNTDFIKLNKNHEKDVWSEHETLLLLEGIEMFGSYEPTNINGNINANTNSQWDKIAEHVASKSREQCIIKFIQLPIEDKYLTKLIDSNTQSQPKSESSNESLVLEVVKKLIADKDGEQLITEGAKVELENASQDQTNLITQISELTLSKLNLKLEKIDSLQSNILKIENQLSLERKQLLVERWIQFEKIQKLKAEKPELALILDDLLKPVQIDEVKKSLLSNNQNTYEDQSNSVNTESNGTIVEKLPLSVVKPKTYQYWSG